VNSRDRRLKSRLADAKERFGIRNKFSLGNETKDCIQGCIGWEFVRAELFKEVRLIVVAFLSVGCMGSGP
jgi:hypothetical protein